MDLWQRDREVIWKSLQRIEAKVDLLLGVTVNLAQKEKVMLDDIQAAVEAQTTVIDSVVTLLNKLSAKVAELVAAGTVDPAKVTELTNAIKANAQRLADAVAANTPTE